MMGLMGGGMMGPEMMQMMGQGMGMMATGGPSATMVLRMSEPLGLSEDQRAQLQAIQAEGAAAVQMHAEAMMAAHRNAAGALAASPADFAAYEQGLREAVEHLVQTHLAMARSAAEAQAVLMAEQRERLRSGMQMMQMMETMMQMMQSPADAPAAGDPAHAH
jgi:predicted RNA-binding Zn ribbon-like protein